MNWEEVRLRVLAWKNEHPEWGWAEIGKELGCVPGTVQSAMSRRGVRLDASRGKSTQRSQNLKKVEPEAVRLWHLGLSNPQIAAEMGGRDFDGFVCDLTAQNLADMFFRLKMKRDDETRRDNVSQARQAQEDARGAIRHRPRRKSPETL